MATATVNTTIKVSVDTRRRIDAAKEHPRETVDDVLQRYLPAPREGAKAKPAD